MNDLLPPLFGHGSRVVFFLLNKRKGHAGSCMYIYTDRKIDP